MRILIVGGGAIGGVTAAYLTKAGIPTALLVRREEAAAELRTQGMTVSGRRELTIPIDAYSSADDIEGVFDCILIVTKAYDMPEAARNTLKLLAEGGLMVSLQNGICREEFSDIVGEKRAAACIVSFSSSLISDTHVEFTGEGGYLLGRFWGGADERLRALAAALENAAPATVVEDILPYTYSKLIINSGIACGGAICGLPLGKMLSRAGARRFFISIVREDMALADALGITVPPFGGKLDYYGFVRGNGFFSSLKRHIMLFIIGAKYMKLTSSSLISLRRGRPTEVDVLNGWISRTAKTKGVPTPVNDRLVAMIREIEDGKRKIDPANISELMQR